MAELTFEPRAGRPGAASTEPVLPRTKLARPRAGLSEDDVPLAMLLLAFATFALIVPPQADTFYHLRSGRTMWESGWFLEREIFSHTAYGLTLHNHWWLSQLLFYGLHAIGGPVLLTAAIGSCGFLALLMAWRMVRGGMEVRLLALLALLMILPQWSLRPQVLSMLFMMLVLRCVMADRLTWVLPMIVLWANAHAMVLFGVAIAGIAAVDALLWSPHRLPRAGMVALAAAAAPMASPLGVHYWPRVFETVRESRLLEIHEYRSALAAGADALGFWLLLAVLILAAVRGSRSRPDPGDRILLATSALLAVAAVLSIRNASFFALVAVPAVSRLLPIAGPPRVRAASRPAVLLLAGSTALAAGFVVHRWRDGGVHNGWRPLTPAASAAVRDCPGPMYNGFGEGGVLMWFVPEQRVFVDGRVEAYPADFLHRVRHADVFARYRELFTEYGVRCAVVRTESPLARALRGDSSATLAFADESWSVFTLPLGTGPLPVDTPMTAPEGVSSELRTF